jgi:hypothetical protein
MICFAVALAFIGISTGQARASLYTINFTDTGWWDNTGTHSATNKNYAVGNGSALVRDYFVFNLAGVSGTVVGATLNIFNPVNGQSGTLRTWSVFDVSTPIVNLMATNSGQTSIYADLGSGTNLGNNTGPQTNNTVLSTSLNAAGLAYIQSGLGGMIAFGGDYVGATSNNYLYGFSGQAGHEDEIRQLVIETRANTVPVPAGIVMSSIGIFGIGAFTWLRRRQTKLA